MDWGSLVSSILPTIGTVVGGLLGINKIEDGVMYFSHKGVQGSQQEFASTIYCENGQYFLYNQSSSQNDIVTMTFPARGQTGAETVMVPGRQSFEITPLFKENAQGDNSQFELIACQANKKSADGSQQLGINISSSGQGIQVGNQKQAIGAYLEVEVKQQQIIVYPKNGMKLQSLPMVSVQGSGDTDMRVMDIVGDPQKIVIQLPQPLLQNDIVTVDIVATVQSQVALSELMTTQKHANMLCEVNSMTANRIENAPRLNWRNV